MKYFSIFDKKAETFSLLSPAVNEEVYIRGLTSALVSNLSSPYVDFADDYEIHCLCDVDEDTGYVHVFESGETKVAPMGLVVNRMYRLIERREINAEDVQDEV